jgi:hypothetical protein
MKMFWLTRLPMRKPLVVLATAIFLIMFIRAHVTGIDIPPNAAGVASTFIGVVFAGYFGSSAYESCRGNREEEKPNGNDG